jgi:hypothetical protein
MVASSNQSPNEVIPAARRAAATTGLSGGAHAISQ